MKQFVSFPRAGVFLALAAAGMAALVSAQRTATQPPTAQASAAAQVKIKNVPKPGRGLLVSTPDFGARATGLSQPLSRGRPKEWAVIDVTYETKSPAKWTDNVYATFYVMTEGMSPDRKQELSFYTLRVQYVNVADGDHRAGVVLPPSILERYGQVVAIACEITADGADKPDVKSEISASYLSSFKDDWWKNDQVMNNQKTEVKKRDGLLERSKTPFALVYPDDYEAVR